MGKKIIGAHCSLCGNDNITDIGKPPATTHSQQYIDKNYQVVKCRDCRYYFVIPPISFSPEEWSKLYGNSYFTELTPWWTQKREKDRTNRLNRLESFHKGDIKTFLDVGCGEGYMLREADRRGWQPYGVDVYDNREEFSKDVSYNFSLGDLFSVTFKDDFFDVIYLDSVLEHVLNPVEYIKELRRILKPGGVIYFGVPNEDNIVNDMKMIIRNKLMGKNISSRIMPFKPPYHINGFSKKSFTQILLKNNMIILQLRNFSGLNEWRKQNLFSRTFFAYLFMVPLYILGIPFSKLRYLDAIVTK